MPGERTQAIKQTDGRNQTYYLPCFAVDKNTYERNGLYSLKFLYAISVTIHRDLGYRFSNSKLSP